MATKRNTCSAVFTTILLKEGRVSVPLPKNHRAFRQLILKRLYCERSIAEKIVEGDYMLSVKGNHEVLLDDIVEAFTHSKIEDEYIGKQVGHDRVESRTTREIRDLGWRCNKDDWMKLVCIIMVFATRYNKKKGAQEKSVRYYISSKAANAKYFNGAVRSHWRIENKLHWRMDVIFGEDKSKRQAENSAQNFSLINKAALNKIRHYKPDEASGSKKISMIRKRKMASRDNEHLLDVLLSFNTKKIKIFMRSALLPPV